VNDFDWSDSITIRPQSAVAAYVEDSAVWLRQQSPELDEPDDVIVILPEHLTALINKLIELRQQLTGEPTAPKKLKDDGPALIAFPKAAP
jgi:hypothetical protein